MKPATARLAALAAALALAGCAAVSDVRGVATGSPQAAYELRGARLATLQAQALRLCPDGHEEVRSWQRYAQPSDTWWDRWFNQATEYNGLGDRQAVLVVVCKPPAAAPAAAASAASAP